MQADDCLWSAGNNRCRPILLTAGGNERSPVDRKGKRRGTFAPDKRILGVSNGSCFEGVEKWTTDKNEGADVFDCFPSAVETSGFSDANLTASLAYN